MKYRMLTNEMETKGNDEEEEVVSEKFAVTFGELDGEVVVLCSASEKSSFFLTVASVPLLSPLLPLRKALGKIKQRFVFTKVVVYHRYNKVKCVWFDYKL